MNHKKKGQITLFVIIGVLLLFTIGFLYGINSLVESSREDTNIKEETTFIASTSSIKSYTEQCIKNSAKTATTFFGLVGSRMNSPGGNFNLNEDFSIAYLRVDGDNYLGTLPEWETSLGNLLNIFIQNCDFTIFEEQGFEITKTEPSTQVFIGEQQINFIVEYPITISKDSITKEVKDFNVNVPLNLVRVHDMVNKIIEKTINNPGFIPLSYMLQFNINATTTSFQEDETIVYELIDYNEDFGTFRFLFADKEGENFV